MAVTKASLHYHFASKADLGRELIVRYQVVFGRALETIDATSTSALDRLQRYVALYDSVLRDDRMCLCGMFAAEYSTLPSPMQQELRRFFDVNEDWLTAVLEQGLRAREFSFWDAPQERARVFLGALEGAMLVARSYKDDRRFRVAAEHLLADLNADARAGKSVVSTQRKRRSAVRR